MKWIKVEDSLPEDNTYCLVATSSGLVDKSFFSLNKEFLKSFGLSYSRKQHGKFSGYFELSHSYGYKITHWALLPKHPLVENNHDTQ